MYFKIGFCAHGRAPAMYSESLLTTTPFYGRECDSYEKFLAGVCDNGKVAIMGEHTPSEYDKPQLIWKYSTCHVFYTVLCYSTRGVFFLQTNSESPFSLGPFST